VLSLAVSGCAGRRVPDAAPSKATASEPASSAVVTAPGDSLEVFMAKVRQAAERARPVRPTSPTIEGQDERLAATLQAASALPSPEAFRAVAREYRRLRIMDRAFDYLNRARALDPRDAATYDELARTWRDSGFPGLALGDGHRAVYYAPASPVVRNTLGTVLQSLGQRRAARLQFEIALQLDPTAVYALNNLCYGWILEGEAGKATEACRAALRLDPGLLTARNNLGIAYAASNEIDAARAEFERSGDRAAALYNIGIMHLARREYTKARGAFGAAQEARPAFRDAAMRVRQAQELLAAGGEE
jgi:tetratricopeptide (TPR) repeat protein